MLTGNAGSHFQARFGVEASVARAPRSVSCPATRDWETLSAVAGVNLLRADVTKVGEGLTLAAGAYEAHSPLTLASSPVAPLGFGVVLESSTRTAFSAGTGGVEVAGPAMIVLSNPSGVPEAVRHFQRCTSRFVMLRMSEASVDSLLHSCDPCLSDLLAGLVGESGSVPSLRSIALSEPVRYAAEQVFDCSLQGSGREIYLHAKALELFALFCDAFTPQQRQELDPCIRQSDIVRIYRARDLLLADLRKDWSLLRLASDVGINVKKLKLGFRDVFRTTVFRFLREERLKRAEQLLRCQGWNVDQTAYAVGYSSPSHFSQLFRHRFGYAPCDYRRGASLASRTVAATSESAGRDHR